MTDPVMPPLPTTAEMLAAMAAECGDTVEDLATCEMKDLFSDGGATSYAQPILELVTGHADGLVVESSMSPDDWSVSVNAFLYLRDAPDILGDPVGTYVILDADDLDRLGADDRWHEFARVIGGLGRRALWLKNAAEAAPPLTA